MIDRSLMWREIRALRANPPRLAGTDDDRRKLFGSSLQQAEELASAAANSGYATKPIQLYYAVSQAFRAACAAHLEDDWTRSGHGLSVPDCESAAITDFYVKPSPRKRDLHAGAMEVAGENPLSSQVSIGQLLASLVELRGDKLPGLDLPRPLLVRNALPYDVLKSEGVASAPFVTVAVDGLPEDVSKEDLEKLIKKYPSLDTTKLTSWPRWPERSDRWPVKWESDAEEDSYGVTRWRNSPEGKPLPLLGLPPLTEDTADSYREGFESLGPALSRNPQIRVAKPGIGDERWVLGDLASWWALLLGLSSLARYHPSQWQAALAIDQERLAPALERVLNLAEDVIPLYVFDALIGASAEQKRTPFLPEA